MEQGPAGSHGVVGVVVILYTIGAPQVNITSDSGTTITSPDNFEFQCSSNVSANFTIEVGGATEGDRIKNESISDTMVVYSLPGTKPSDNGTTFRCVAIIDNTNYTSDMLTLQVLCKYNNIVSCKYDIVSCKYDIVSCKYDIVS